MKNSPEKKPRKVEQGLRMAAAGAVALGMVNATEPKAEAAPLQQQAHEVQEGFDVRKEVEAFLEKVASMPFRQRSAPSALIEVQFNNFARSLEQRVSYFSLLKQDNLMEPAAPMGVTTSIAQERAKKILLPMLDTIDTKIRLGDPGTLEGTRRNNLRILKESVLGKISQPQ